MKLLAKNAEDRYQTAAGLTVDLRKCLAEWESHRGIEPFPLGASDVSDRLVAPERLYGRQGLLMDEVYHHLKQPGTQALIISVVAVVAAGVCLYFARLLDREHEQNSGL